MSGATTARQRGGNGGTVAGANGQQLMSFQGLGSQAASFLRGGWLRSARLALTGATPAQLLTDEVTGGCGLSLPDARTLGFISRAAFDQDDCSRIMQVLHKRLAKFDKNLWRESYKALIVVEHLLVHGPGGVADQLRGGDAVVIGEMSTLQYIDEKGFNWGLAVKNKSDKVLKLLEDPSFQNEQRDRARKVSHEIQGFGSFNLTTFSSASSKTDQYYALPAFIARSNSHYESISTEESDGDDTSWRRSEPGPETDESSELFLTRDVEGPKKIVVPESRFDRDVLPMNSGKSDSRHCPAAKGTAFLSDSVAVEESEPFLRP